MGGLKQLFGLYHFGRRSSWVAYSAKVVGQISVSNAGASINNSNGRCASVIYCQTNSISSLQPVYPRSQTSISWECSSSTTLVEKLEFALRGDCVDEAWEAFSNFKQLHGFPNLQLLSKLIILMSYSADHHWIRKAYDLVLVIQKEKPHLLRCDSLSRLALSLVRSQMAIPASTIMRIMLEKGMHPPMDVWSAFFSHLVKSQIGSYLASDILIEICKSCLHHKLDAKNPKKKKLMSPNITIFNLVLDSCVRYVSTMKAQQIIQLMPQVGIVADANSIIIIARIFEVTGQRDELNKLRRHVDGLSSVTLNHHYQQFYDCLLSLHFKYKDIDAAAELVLELYRRPKSIHIQDRLFIRNNRIEKPCIVQIGSSNLRMGYKLIVDPKKLKGNFVVEAHSHSGLVLCIDGNLIPSSKALSKLINGYVRERKVTKLSNLLISIQKETDPEKFTLSADVVDACVQLGWLEAAHDILDDLESAEIPIRINTYTSLLRAYCRANMWEESKVLLKQMRQVGHCVNLSDENAASLCLLPDTSVSKDTENTNLIGKSHLAELLDRESSKKDSTTHLVFEFNSTIFFFCKAKMIEDALKTFKQMQRANVLPTVQSFSLLVSCYSSLKMYREITILWGEIKRRIEDGVLAANRDLFECLLWNFLRGGYFERVMDITNYMTKHNMFMDKWKYRREFLNLHKDLYRNLKASDARTDAQRRRLEHVRAFRRWVGIDQK